MEKLRKKFSVSNQIAPIILSEARAVPNVLPDTIDGALVNRIICDVLKIVYSYIHYRFIPDEAVQQIRSRLAILPNIPRSLVVKYGVFDDPSRVVYISVQDADLTKKTAGFSAIKRYRYVQMRIYHNEDNLLGVAFYITDPKHNTVFDTFITNDIELGNACKVDFANLIYNQKPAETLGVHVDLAEQSSTINIKKLNYKIKQLEAEIAERQLIYDNAGNDDIETTDHDFYEMEEELEDLANDLEMYKESRQESMREIYTKAYNKFNAKKHIGAVYNVEGD